MLDYEQTGLMSYYRISDIQTPYNKTPVIDTFLDTDSEKR
jgi:hypothetical protein